MNTHSEAVLEAFNKINEAEELMRKAIAGQHLTSDQSNSAMLRIDNVMVEARRIVIPFLAKDVD